MGDLLVQEVSAKELYASDEQIEKVISEIREAATLTPDISTASGRKAIASMARKVASSKVYLDTAGKDLVADLKAKTKFVDGKRKHIRDTLDSLRDEVRKPLTEWEQANEERESKISEIRDDAASAKGKWIDLTIDELEASFARVDNTDANEEYWGDYLDEFIAVRDAAITDIGEAIARRREYDNQQKELAELQAKQEAEARKAEQERVRKDAEDKARRELEEEQAKKEAEEQAELERREHDIAHKRKVNRAAVDAMIKLGIEEDKAKELVRAIAKGRIPQMYIGY